MANITIRNIPDEIFLKIKHLSESERRSLNNELLVIIEKGTDLLVRKNIDSEKLLSKSLQIHLLKNLSGSWEDNRTTEQIIDDIYKTRTMGREFEL
jgi:hypothetical protein